MRETGVLKVPFAQHVCEHLTRVARQGTLAHSMFLDASSTTPDSSVMLFDPSVRQEPGEH